MERLVGALLLCLLPGLALAGTDAQEINARNSGLLVQRLVEQTATYSVYVIDSQSGKVEYSDIWRRKTAFSPDGARVTLDWEWFRAGELVRSVTAVADRRSFAPLSEHSWSKARGEAQFEFHDGSMTRSTGEPVPLPEPIFNWEMDLELLSLLPIEAVGQRFKVALMDPFQAEPAYREYAVTREDTVALHTAEPGIASWVLRIEYERDAWAEFWIGKNSHQVLKMQELYGGKYRYKVRLY
jgi:hypothetical protein